MVVEINVMPWIITGIVMGVVGCITMLIFGLDLPKIISDIVTLAIISIFYWTILKIIV